MTSEAVPVLAKSWKIVLTSLKSAEKNGRGRAYVARLVRNGDIVERVWGDRVKRGSAGNRIELLAPAAPGDIFEARRWRWDDERQGYEGGTVYLGVSETMELVLLTRDEAMASLFAPRLPAPAGEDLPQTIVATRLVPDDVRLLQC